MQKVQAALKSGGLQSGDAGHEARGADTHHFYGSECFARVASLGIAYNGAGVVLVTGGGFRDKASLGSTLLTSRGNDSMPKGPTPYLLTST